MALSRVLFVSFCLIASLLALPYDEEQVLWNLNQNQSASNVLDYWGQWDGHEYTPSPKNWRFPFYTVMLDRYVNGDPTNDNANGTAWEQDPYGTQLRHGGDIRGFCDSLDYIHGMGFRGVYFVGSPFINMPWGADAFSPLDLTLLDAHFGTIAAWRDCIDQMHARGMYVLLENTMATLGDLIGFENFLNVSAPLNLNGYNAIWKTGRRYHDFDFGNEEQEICDTQFPRFWDDYGLPVTENGTQYLKGCRDSEFNQFGDIEAFGHYPEWQRQLTKFASVQDRLRDWKPSVRAKVQHMSCITIAMLDIDGYRMDKGEQITVDAQGEFADFVRQCARRFGKDNFFMPGEIVSGNDFGSIYVGRGKQPDQAVNDTDIAVRQTVNNTDQSLFLRGFGKSAFDSACFHYSTYRTMIRFLGMDGDLGATGESPTDFIDAYKVYIQTNDLINANTGVYDPRHMFGAQNQDVFRWPAIHDGTRKQNLGNFITTLVLPGIPLLEWGEEQAFYLMDSTAANYVFGRQAMSANTAWQSHGCYNLGNVDFKNWPAGNYSNGCSDDWNSLDHRDPAHPIRNLLIRMYELRRRYPVLNDGYFVETITRQTFDIVLPGSSGTPTATGIWSVRRAGWPDLGDDQDFSKSGTKTQDVWLLYHNQAAETKYSFDCSGNNTGLLAPYASGTTVKNLLYPYDEVTLGKVPQKLKLDNSTSVDGCLNSMVLPGWGYKAYVPKDQWLQPSPVITRFVPYHDSRLLSGGPDNNGTVPIEVHFSDEMDCKNTLGQISVNSTTETGTIATLDQASFSCNSENDADVDVSKYTGPVTGQIPSTWRITGNLINVADGIHTITVGNATTASGNSSIGTNSTFLLRIGQPSNPLVFPRTGNYSDSVLKLDSETKGLYITHSAAGADQFRYSLNWASSWSDWQPYTGGRTNVARQPWSGTKEQAWIGDHVQVQYYSRKTGSLAIQQGQVAAQKEYESRYPHLFVHGSWNEYGYDSGIPQTMALKNNSRWQYDLMTEWPSEFQVNVWGNDPNGQPDLTRAFGDVDDDGVMDLVSPVSLVNNAVLLQKYPPNGSLAYRIDFHDADMRYFVNPIGSPAIQKAIFALLAALPIIAALLCVWLYMHSFYHVKQNKIGKKVKQSFLPVAMREKLRSTTWLNPDPWATAKAEKSVEELPAMASPRRTVLIATMEYFIEDWDIKIKIGGLGVMSQLMGQHLDHLNLIWVIPCVNGIQYPVDQTAKPITCTILGAEYTIQVQYHYLRNITYVLLDAPIFRTQTKAEPYPTRMDDIDSAVYYSAWNTCIAEIIQRFPVDLYHINDYHGALAPLHLLPRVIPCCLSLHNAEFQGLWPMRTTKEFDEVCKVYNLQPNIVRKYVQYGEVFNLLHAGASYLRVHQGGYGAAGVSTKYGKRSFARYPVLWGLKQVMGLPNPDPTDTDAVAETERPVFDPAIERFKEAERAEAKRLAQGWANLKMDTEADLFVFVGRWSLQKGIDLIADVFPTILAEYPHAQLICVGPVIDLYGRFAALKLARLMRMYPDRVYSRPEFTSLPPYIFSGAEFALMPSRDEPFGLVAVEFGRKGVLSVGARVGGLGNMPGWWFTVESTTSKHLLSQFQIAIESALSTDAQVRSQMRAQSTIQRFPVAEWKMKLETMHDNAIKTSSQRYKNKASPRASNIISPDGAGNLTVDSPTMSKWNISSRINSRNASGNTTRAGSRAASPTPQVPAQYSLGRHVGPGHDADQRKSRQRKKLSKSAPASRETSMNRSGRMRNKIRGLTTPKGELSEPVTPDGEERGRRRLPNARNELAQSRRTSYFGGPVEEEGNTIIAKSRQGDLRNFDFRSFENIHGQTMDDSVIRDDDASSHYSLAPEIEEIEALPADEYILTREQIDKEKRRASENLDTLVARNSNGLATDTSQVSFAPSPHLSSGEPSIWTHGTIPSDATSGSDDRTSQNTNPKEPFLSVAEITKGKRDLKLQTVEPTFNDPTGHYYRKFDQRLEKLSANNSQVTLCIENYLIKSERDWFSRYRRLKMGQSSEVTPKTPSYFRPWRQQHDEAMVSDALPATEGMAFTDNADQFLLRDDYTPPTGVKMLMLRRIGHWPLYTIFLAFGQIISANSYQITLLTGAVGQAAEKLYIIAAVYLCFSIIWWLVFRRLRSIYVLAMPFALYGIAFFLLGMTPYAKTIPSRGWIQNVATGFYGAASASGAFHFSLNFGSEGSVPASTWAIRACLIQGVQQIYVVFLWYWGAQLTKLTVAGMSASTLITYGPALTAITVPIAIVMWVIGTLLFIGLPDYYRQHPGSIPSFYRSLTRRKIIIWFMVSVILQNYFLSAPYGRNWRYLWSSQHAPGWAVALLIIFFFIIVWTIALYTFSYLSRSHTWILPIFALGLGAPRWAQMLWGVSGMGQWVPWAGSPVAGALLGRALWLWLGVLDAIQGVGIGMILLQTLTRFHVTFALVCAQVLGSVATIVARATSPDRDGPGTVFPNLVLTLSGLDNAAFWIGLISQGAVVIGFLWWFRGEQLMKP